MIREFFNVGVVNLCEMTLCDCFTDTQKADKLVVTNYDGSKIKLRSVRIGQIYHLRFV